VSGAEVDHLAILGMCWTSWAWHGVQAEVQQKYELLAQLEEKYGDDLLADEGDSSDGRAAVDWQENGDLSVHIIEATMSKIPKNRCVRLSTKLTIYGQQGYGKTKSTTWADSRTPWWNEKISFERCCRQDVMVIQVRH
jgi:hypothetical protein